MKGIEDFDLWPPQAPAEMKVSRRTGKAAGWRAGWMDESARSGMGSLDISRPPTRWHALGPQQPCLVPSLFHVPRKVSAALSAMQVQIPNIHPAF